MSRIRNRKGSNFLFYNTRIEGASTYPTVIRSTEVYAKIHVVDAFRRIQKTDDMVSSRRVRFPEDEEKFPWLSMLLDAYAIIDEGVAFAVKREEEDVSIKLACREGCDNCCRTHRDIPLYPLELIGISWFVTEKVVGPRRTTIKKQLEGHGEADACPFLTDRSCAIHLLRPVACRQFNVFYEPCDEGEDPYFTRRDEVLTPLQEFTDRAFSVMLPFYGVRHDADKDKVVKKIIQTQALNLQSFDWNNLVTIMEEFDSKIP